MRLHNTLSKSKVDFVPLKPGKAGLYVCGPTVYDYVHIGNLAAYVFSDTLRRVLEHTGYSVTMVKNITDVGHLTADDLAQGDSGEDKIEKKARLEGKSPQEIALFYETYFHEKERKLNILPAEYYPRATEHIEDMIALIEKLIERGHAYEVNGNVFYDVTSFDGYGKLSGNTLDKLKVGARLEEHPDKKNPWDFALWLKAPEGHLMHWPSPWGEGYPGWHIECSAMSMKYLGESFDLHTGGEDHIFPHHEAEIAQSEGATGNAFVRYWMHFRHMLINEEKMSKSKKNFYTLEDIEKQGYTAMDLRMTYLLSHYRSQMNFVWESLDQGKKTRESLFTTYARVKKLDSKKGYTGEEETAQVVAALEDDLNTPLAVTHAIALSKNTNASLDNNEPVHATAIKKNFEIIFSLFGLEEVEVEIPESVTKLAEERVTARNSKNFSRADELRDAILDAGFLVEDSSEGFVLKRK